eukprot:1906666-Prymnesium_polylepis.3
MPRNVVSEVRGDGQPPLHTGTMPRGGQLAVRALVSPALLLVCLIGSPDSHAVGLAEDIEPVLGSWLVLSLSMSMRRGAGGRRRGACGTSVVLICALGGVRVITECTPWSRLRGFCFSLTAVR